MTTGIFDPNNVLVPQQSNVLSTGVPVGNSNQFQQGGFMSPSVGGYMSTALSDRLPASQSVGGGIGLPTIEGAKDFQEVPDAVETRGMTGFEKGTSVAKLGLGAFNAYMNWDALKLAKESQAEQEKQFWQQYGDQKSLTQEALAGKYQRQASAKGGGADATEATAWKKARSVLA